MAWAHCSMPSQRDSLRSGPSSPLWHESPPHIAVPAYRPLAFKYTIAFERKTVLLNW